MNRKLTSEEIKSYSIEILKDIKRVCNELNINYFLDSGTLLGAIRHNGFIPWDDDIDIAMPRPDYEKFIRQYNKYSNPRYKVKSIETDSNYGFPYAKVYDTSTILYEYGKNPFGLGLSIDIFTIDGYPDSEEERKTHYQDVIKIFDKYAAIEGLSTCKYSINPRYYKKNIKIFLAKHFLQRYKAKQVIKHAKFYDYDKTNYAGIKVCIYYHPQDKYMKKSCWNPTSHIFEDDNYTIPEGFDLVLKSNYGNNYMTPPPENKRNSTHGLEIYIR